jgi:hypothetical protein
VLEALLIAQFHAREIEHAILHGTKDPLPAPCARALVKRCTNAECEMKARSGVADLRAGYKRRSFAEAGR